MDSTFRPLTAEDRAISRRRAALQGSRPLVTGTEMGASRVGGLQLALQ